MLRKQFLFLIILLNFSYCSSPEKDDMSRIDIQGHRGCRGLMPENSIPGFLKALDLGVTTLELDVVISGDSQVVVSHEPFIRDLICENDGVQKNLFQMTYEEIAQYDCGSKPIDRFPTQEKISVSKPLLFEVFEKVQNRIHQSGLPQVFYNIEIKSTPEGDGRYHPAPSDFVRLVLELIRDFNLQDHVVIQSFDKRSIAESKRQNPAIPVALLVEDNPDWNEELRSLDFSPEIYSCYHALLDQEIVDSIQQLGIKVIPWTVNDEEKMKALISWGVDGIITDYPDKLIDLVNTSE